MSCLRPAIVTGTVGDTSTALAFTELAPAVARCCEQQWQIHEAEGIKMAEPQVRKPGSSAWQWGRTAQTQRALLDAAREVFTRQGFADASIADVVERAGSSVGSLYHHFGGKSELFLALWQEHQLAYEEAASTAVAAARQAGVDDPAKLFAAGRARTSRAAGSGVTWPCCSRPATGRPASRSCAGSAGTSGSGRTTRSSGCRTPRSTGSMPRC